MIARHSPPTNTSDDAPTTGDRPPRLQQLLLPIFVLLAAVLAACSLSSPAATTPEPAATATPGAAATPRPTVSAKPVPLTPGPAPTLPVPIVATPEPTRAGQTSLNIATGGTGGAYQPLGAAFADILNRSVSGVRARAVPGRGPQENLTAMQRRDAQLAFTTADIAHYAFFGVETYKEREQTHFNALAGLHLDTVQVVVASDAKIASLGDLRGKRVGVGPGGSGNERAAQQLLGAVGLSYGDLEPAIVSFSEMAVRYQERQIDALIIAAVAPDSVVREAFASRPSRLLSIPANVVSALQRKYAFYVGTRVPAGSYAGQAQPIETLGIRNLLVVRDDLDPTLVYQMTRAFWEHRGDLAKAHERGREIAREQTLKGITVPVHPGAKRYYDETRAR